MLLLYNNKHNKATTRKPQMNEDYISHMGHILTKLHLYPLTPSRGLNN